MLTCSVLPAHCIIRTLLRWSNSFFSFIAFPTSNGGMQNGSSVGTCTRCTHVFACLAPTGMLSRCLSTKNYALEIKRKFIKCALLVGFSSFFMWFSHVVLPIDEKFCATRKTLHGHICHFCNAVSLWAFFP